MPLPKKNKKHIPLTYSKTLYPRRQELVDKINENGTYNYRNNFIFYI